MILSLLANRKVGATLCPSEVARALAGGSAGDEWREAMPIVHTAADRLRNAGAIWLSWKGVSLETRSGPYRISLAAAADPKPG